jgi:hypothetical protein
LANNADLVANAPRDLSGTEASSVRQVLRLRCVRLSCGFRAGYVRDVSGVRAARGQALALPDHITTERGDRQRRPVSGNQSCGLRAGVFDAR